MPLSLESRYKSLFWSYIAFHILPSRTWLCVLCFSIGQGGLEIRGNGDWPHFPLDVYHCLPVGDSWPLLASLALGDDLATCHRLSDNDIRSLSNVQPVQLGQDLPCRQLHLLKERTVIRRVFMLMAMNSIFALTVLKRNVKTWFCRPFLVMRFCMKCESEHISSVKYYLGSHSVVIVLLSRSSQPWLYPWLQCEQHSSPPLNELN